MVVIKGKGYKKESVASDTNKLLNYVVIIVIIGVRWYKE